MIYEVAKINLIYNFSQIKIMHFIMFFLYIDIFSDFLYILLILNIIYFK